ncbi:MAG: N-acetyltransferase [Prevotellaceae bacterium]|jgi:predicted GNAT family acetyltransferase|nr:N-acetyltransferase [Prevotellaceae bacterium]
MNEPYELIDNTERRQYEFRIGERLALISYLKPSAGKDIFLTHTEVPISLGGKGIGSQLVEQTLKDIEQKGLEVVPLCPFVASYIHKHPQWKRLVKHGYHVQ